MLVEISKGLMVE